jgi:hypothetical protein
MPALCWLRLAKPPVNKFEWMPKTAAAFPLPQIEVV